MGAPLDMYSMMIGQSDGERIAQQAQAETKKARTALRQHELALQGERSRVLGHTTALDCVLAAIALLPRDIRPQVIQQVRISLETIYAGELRKAGWPEDKIQIWQHHQLDRLDQFLEGAEAPSQRRSVEHHGSATI